MPRFPFSRFIVKDRSMEPFLCHGDHVLMFNWTNIKVGDVVVFKLFNQYFVKRIKKISGKNIFVEGDNRNMSLKIGPIKVEQVVGKVVLRY